MTRQANEHWEWGNPLHQLLAIIAEATHNGNVYQFSKKKTLSKKDLLRIPRPGDSTKLQEKLGGEPVPLDELTVWLGPGWAELLA
ncbi:hypothetical protein EJ997_10280 [Flaviflexus ciconiae]|uniref:Uncharacterized protein n=1 Tax=Flaviflexus ciconiae TaxID=2496867 RepID=A0A3S9PZ58_9ACTO|nr:hypothetical protein [Flaviflexus ciconiae]AZQ77670.1 hypothetical protein EJ997_10280 [Flaviflexus ciconiae]